QFNDRRVSGIKGSAGQLGNYWLNHPQHRRYAAVTFEPGGIVVLPGNVLNTWRGFGIEERQGDWHLMQDHIRDVLADASEEAERYILNWTAWAVQNPGKRAEAALILRGKEGTGKGVFLHTLRKVFEPHSRHENSIEGITAKFNEHLLDVAYLFIDEVSWTK